MTRTIWFVPSQESHLGRLGPLMSALRGRGHDVRVLCVDAVVPLANAIRPKLVTFGYPFEDFRSPGLNPDRHWAFQALQNRRLTRAARAFFACHPADGLVIGSGGPAVTRALVHAAQGKGVPAILVGDGIVLPSNPCRRRSLLERPKLAIGRLLKRMTEMRPGGLACGADLILVMNASGREALAEEGVDVGRVRVVGSPEYDTFAQRVRAMPVGAEPPGLRERLGLPPERPVVLFAHQPAIGDQRAKERLVADMAEAARQCGATLLVKLHPRATESPAEWARWARGEGFSPSEIAFVRNECSSFEAVQLCTVCVTVFSTVALEVLICGKPLVLVQYLDTGWWVPYGKTYGAALDAFNPAELRSAIVSTVTDAEVRDRLRTNALAAMDKELCGLDGRSVERMVAAVADLVEGGAAAAARAVTDVWLG